ncbi:MAG: NAD(P)H-hydrate epimerase [Pirellulaceae bacterium]|nr:MAG: NAD(P)H-hydrate epimerase [Pirellulaceae bacterium]
MTDWDRLRQRVLTSQEVRLVDRIAIEFYHMHSLVLMENAASGCAAWLRDEFVDPQRAVVLCGRGNNGGDGLVIARHLRVAGWECDAIVHGNLDGLRPDAQANARIFMVDAPDRVHFVEQPDEGTRQLLERADVIIDAMLGTGATGNPKPPLDTWIDWANRSRGRRIAIDIPTGIDADSGQRYAPAFQAEKTLTFVAQKPAMVAPGAESLFGAIAVMPIGLPQRLIAELVVQSPEELITAYRSKNSS